jgi:predicted transcriptional regulator
MPRLARQIAIRLSPRLAAGLAQAARALSTPEHRTTTAAVVRLAILDYLDRHGWISHDDDD